VAVYLPDRDWAVVLGEVKTANKIDENDIANLKSLRDALLAKGVRCLLAFSALKNVFSPEEVSQLRELIERSRPVTLSSGVSLPNLPLVLTGPDLSHHPMSEDHPWRWDSKDYSGVFGTAITSCERNLGLKGYGLRLGWCKAVSARHRIAVDKRRRRSVHQGASSHSAPTPRGRHVDACEAMTPRRT